MKIQLIIICLYIVVAINCHHDLMAQDIEITYTSEIQANTHRKTNWVNLLRCNYALKWGKHASLDASTISIAKTNEKRLANDLQTFSNIEEENTPLAISVLGIKRETEKSTLFLGIRNLNEDYFISPGTSLFTNSSCGIFPTLSTNYPIANYPMASLGIHYKLKISHWNWNISCYNGTGYKNLAGKENAFRFCPSTDGILGISSLDYQVMDNGYYTGIAVYHGPDSKNEHMDQQEKQAQTSDVMIWAYMEQKLFPHMNILLQYSINPTTSTGCNHYSGIGILLYFSQIEGGIFMDYANFTRTYEWAGEITCKIPFMKNGYLQPALHVIKNMDSFQTVALLRFSISLKHIPD